MNQSQFRGIIRGAIMTSDGSIVADASVSVIEGSSLHSDIAALTNELGEFQLSNLEPGTYTLLVNTDESDPILFDVEVEAGRTTRADLILPQ